MTPGACPGGARHAGRRREPARVAIAVIIWFGLAIGAGLFTPIDAVAADPVAADPARAAESDQEGWLRYTVVRGDTLIAIGRRHLENPDDWRAIHAINTLGRRSLILPGQPLLIPPEYRKSEPTLATVVSATGSASTDDGPLTAGRTLAQGANVITGPDSVVTLRLVDGSTLRIAPASRLRIERLRRYHSDRIVEARVRLDQGRAQALATRQRRKPFEIRGGVATAAVRGTDFRVGVEPRHMTSEVLEGGVALAATGTGRSRLERAEILAGFGSAADDSGQVLAPRALLPAPTLSGSPATTADPSPSLPFPAIAGASAYRVRVSRDPLFVSVLRDAVVRDPTIMFDSQQDGEHHLLVRAIDADRIEGFDAKSRIEVRARPFAPRADAPADGAHVFGERAPLRWQPAEAAAGYRVQVAADADFATVLGEARSDAAQIDLTLPGVSGEPRELYWRVAAVGASGRPGPYGRAMRLRWQPGPGAIEARQIGIDTLRLSWPAVSGQRYDVELAADQAFERIIVREQTARAELTIPHLLAGRYHARLRARAPDGAASASVSRAIDITRPVTSGFGEPVMTGTGQPLRPTYP